MNIKEKIELIRQGKNLEEFVNDKNAKVRRAVAYQEYGLDRLINDENPDVRKAVALSGYGLDKLIQDPNQDVAKRVRQWLFLHDMSIWEYMGKCPEKCVLSKAKKLGNKEMNKKKFTVIASVEGYVEMEIEADDVEEASKIACEQVSECDFGPFKDIDWRINQVTDENDKQTLIKI